MTAWQDMTPPPQAPRSGPGGNPGSAPSGRFRSTDVTFGLAGRIAVTAVMLLPYVLFLYSFLLWGMPGVVLYTPLFWRGMRQVWRHSDRVVDRRTASQRGWTTTRPDDVPIVATTWDDEAPPPSRW
ncbi:MAG: hypothetical protein U0Q15_02050 [Kineosporiaceae bacterium]